MFKRRPKIIIFLLVSTAIFLYLLYEISNIFSTSWSLEKNLILGNNTNSEYKNTFYDTENWISGKKDCIQFEYTSISSFKDIGEGFWEINPPERSISRDLQPLIYGTYYAQKLIWDYQHPQDCSTVKYIYAEEHPWGLGSMLHVYGAVLALALNLRRVMIYAPLVNMQWTNGTFCGNEKTLNCFFHPPGGCTPTDEMLKNRRQWDNTNNDDHPVVTVPTDKWQYTFKSRFGSLLPDVFLPLLRCSPIPEKQFRWWWRTQSVTYIIRPNTRTLNQLEILEKQEFPNQKILNGTIGIHVRHGDKHLEMPLLPLQDYVSMAEYLASKKELNKLVFLGTEDPSVIEHAEEFNKKGEWHFYWLEEKRENLGNPDLVKKGDKMVLHAILGVKLQLLTDAHIGTLLSNWCRLILELRSTVGYCAGCPYIDVSMPCSTVLDCKHVEKEFMSGHTFW